MCRIDLVCKLIGPLAIALVTGYIATFGVLVTQAAPLPYCEWLNFVAPLPYNFGEGRYLCSGAELVLYDFQLPQLLQTRPPLANSGNKSGQNYDL